MWGMRAKWNRYIKDLPFDITLFPAVKYCPSDEIATDSTLDTVL